MMCFMECTNVNTTAIQSLEKFKRIISSTQNKFGENRMVDDSVQCVLYRKEVRQQNITSLCKEGKLKEALHALNYVQKTHSQIHSFAYLSLLQGCRDKHAFAYGKQVHAHIIMVIGEPDTFLGNVLLEMYSKSGSVVYAQQVFERTSNRGGRTWATMIEGYAKQGHAKTAFNLFQQMLENHVEPHSTTLVLVLGICGELGNVSLGRIIHALLEKSKEINVFVGSKLVNMYAKCNSLEDACQVFDEIPIRNVVCWNVMIAGYNLHGYVHNSLKLFVEMKQEGIRPDAATFPCIINACSELVSLGLGKYIHAHVVSDEFEIDVFIGSALIDMYSSCGSLDDARRVFDRLSTWNIASYNAMIAGYAHNQNRDAAMSLFGDMYKIGLKMNGITFVNVLHACDAPASLEYGKWIHFLIEQTGYASDVIVGTALIDMYIKCRSMTSARQLFDNMHRKNIVSWNVIIAGYAAYGDGEEALRLFQQMQSNIRPNRITFINVLSACKCIGELGHGKLCHAYTVKHECNLDVYVGSTVIDMYAKFNSINSAQDVFDRMKIKNEVLWNAMITGYVQSGNGNEALNLAFSQMEKEGVKPNNVTLGAVLSACASMCVLQHGKRVHACILIDGLESNPFLANSLIDMYSKCGNIEIACRLFQENSDCSVISWTAMIGSYAQLENSKEILKILTRMQEENAKPDKIAFVSALSACAGAEALQDGKHIHAYILRNGCEFDVVIGSAVIDMYGKCGSKSDAQKTFDRIAVPDVISWTIIIATSAQHGDGKEALNFFCQMQEDGFNPTKATFVSILKACASLRALEHGKRIHADLSRPGYDADIFIGSTLVDMYGKCGRMQDACMVFDVMPQQTLVLWNSLIAGFAQHSSNFEVFVLLENMQQGGVYPDKVTFVSILSACNHVGLIDNGYHYFNSMSQTHGIMPTEQHYACLVDLLGRAGCLEETENLINATPFEPCSVLWTAFLGASKHHGNLHQVESALAHVLLLEPENAGALVSLSNVYAVSG